MAARRTRRGLRGTPEQHAKFAQSTFSLAREALAEARGETTCAGRVERAGRVLRNVGAVEASLVWASGAVPSHDLQQLADAAQDMLDRCAAKSAKSAKPAKRAKAAKRTKSSKRKS